jgi:Tfp pilus assembly protein FimT
MFSVVQRVLTGRDEIGLMKAQPTHALSGKGGLYPIGSPLRRRVRANRRGAFSLIELVAVVGIILVLMAGAVPAFHSIKGGSDFANHLSTIANSLEQSRAYAMTNNTYVFWGIQNANAGDSANAETQRNGTGRVIVGTVASVDGTRIYDPSGSDTQIATDWADKTRSGARLIQLGKTVVCEGITVSDGSPNETLPSTGNLARVSDNTLNLTRGMQTSLRFGFPLGSTPPRTRYSFQTCIQFDPQGAASVVSSQGTSSHAFELGFLRAHGSVVASANANAAVLQIDASTGLLKIYRQ